jgi:hypothetical protein
MLNNNIDSYIEWIFDENVDYLSERFFYIFTFGGKIEKHEKISKVELIDA